MSTPRPQEPGAREADQAEQPEDMQLQSKLFGRSARRYYRAAVGFLDVLGASDISADETFMNGIMSTAEIESRVTSIAPPAGEFPVRSQWFSDNLGASAALPVDGTDPGTATLRVAKLMCAVQAHLFEQFGVLTRGALVHGLIFHGNEAMFGPALVRAVHLEKAADTPRVVIDADVEDALQRVAFPLFEREPLRREDEHEQSAMLSLDFLRAEQLTVRDDQKHALLQRARTGADAAPPAAKAKWAWLISRIQRS